MSDKNARHTARNLFIYKKKPPAKVALRFCKIYVGGSGVCQFIVPPRSELLLFPFIFNALQPFIVSRRF